MSDTDTTDASRAAPGHPAIPVAVVRPPPGRRRPRRRILAGMGLLAVAALATGTWLLFLAPRGLGGPVSVVWVSGQSMEPTLHDRDLVVAYRSASYDVGDIVAFEIPGGGIVIHRVLESAPDGYRFQGDNRDGPDPWVLTADDIIGRRIALVPQGGEVLARLRDARVLAAMTAALVFVLALRRMDGADRENSAATEHDPEASGGDGDGG